MAMLPKRYDSLSDKDLPMRSPKVCLVNYFWNNTYHSYLSEC